MIEQARVVMVGLEGARIGYDVQGFYTQDLHQTITSLVAPLYVRFPIVAEAEEYWEYVAFQTADGITYDEETIYVSLNDAPKNGLLYKQVEETLGTEEAERIPRDYAIKCALRSGTYRIKVYDRDILRHQVPGLPSGARLSAGSGISYHIDASHIKDMYFLHKDSWIVGEFYQQVMPVHSCFDDTDVDHYKGFAVTYDSNTMHVLKMKRYYFPQDPLMANFKDT